MVMSKKASFILKKFHPKATAMNCYIRFVEKESAKEALTANGTIFKDHHIRVDVLKQQDHNQKMAIFVGNIPFDAKDEELWNLFECCGKIESVRLVRDPLTRIGKGYGYVNFESADSVELALQMTDVKINTRQLRIHRADGGESKKKNAKGEKKRKVPRKPKRQAADGNENESKNIVEGNMDETKEAEVTIAKKPKKSPADKFQGTKFTDKKKKKKVNKTDMQKKKMSKLLLKKNAK